MFSRERYVIHQHDAKKAGLHWDFRVTIPHESSKLASFAIPKAKFPDHIFEKLLALKMPDHSKTWLFMADGMKIPEGEYGAGTIKTIQSGELIIEGWSSTYITFVIDGPLIRGRFSLIKIKGKKAKDVNSKNLWILLKTTKQTGLQK